MKHSLIKITAMSFLSMLSQVSMAHPGHDHAHWSSDPIHIITMVAIGTVIVGAFSYKYLLRKPKRLQQQEDKNHDA